MSSYLTFGSAPPRGSSALDVPVAALAGLSVAFAAFAMPADLLARAVEASGLASVLAAAEPPLGFKARIGLGAAGAVLVFALVLLLLRSLDRFGTRRAAAEEAEDTPRLRRRDFHPDAAPRPPLSARDLGEPASEPRSEPELQLPADTEVEPEPEPEVEPEAPLRRTPARPAWLPDERAEPAAAAPEAESQAEPEPAPAIGSSIPELMARLEAGLARRRAAPPPSAAEPAVRAEASDDRLQSAIDSLQRLAARHS